MAGIGGALNCLVRQQYACTILTGGPGLDPKSFYIYILAFIACFFNSMG